MAGAFPDYAFFNKCLKINAHMDRCPDIGFRLVSTGYVLAVTAGMADIFGLGNQPLPQIPYFGPWQAAGVVIGEGIIALGFLIMIPFQRYK